MPYHLAIDIGASSGRCVAGWLKDGVLQIEDVHRFPNSMTERGGHLCWDIDSLFVEILTGLCKCRETGKTPQTASVDTWAVDSVLLDESGAILGDTIAYRDKRTEGCDADVYAKIPEAELYRRTGIQKQLFNSVFQLRAIQRDTPALLDRAASFMMLPDYFHYKLCGKISCEYTNAATTGLVDAVRRDWDYDIINKLGFPSRLFKPLTKPATALGNFSAEIQKATGFNCEVITPAAHDTASAVMSVSNEDAIYISSGTWSLMGIEKETPDCSEEARILNFTNEGGFEKYCFLKNIMGLWLIQETNRELGNESSFAHLSELAEKENINSIIDANNSRFFSPKSMTAEIRAACAETGQESPQTLSQFARVIYRSLAQCYSRTVNEIEGLAGQKYESIYIAGGGARVEYLNRLIAQTTGKTVLANPAEATAIGNIAAQMIACGEFKNLKEARECIAKSFHIKEYKP
ncbi:MAG: rhamnulokinase [Treponema sp.]|nr:rhamnulokinase [Treponema sp.]